MNSPQRVVFDCNVFFQALISPLGPGGQAVHAAIEGRCRLFLAEFVLAELRDVTTRPHLVTKFSFTPERVAIFLESIVECAAILENIPHVFEYPRDPKDALYVDLAVAAGAKLIVSRDLDLLSLGNLSTSDGQEFARRFPDLEILTPTELLNLLASDVGEKSS